MIIQLFAGLIGIFDMIIGTYMALMPAEWFASTPSASATGPFNSHFVTDIGLAYIAGGLAFLAFARWPSWRLAAFGASGFLGFHAIFHLAHVAMGHSVNVGVDIAVAVPALAGLALCWPRQEDAA